MSTLLTDLSRLSIAPTPRRECRAAAVVVAVVVAITLLVSDSQLVRIVLPAVVACFYAVRVGVSASRQNRSRGGCAAEPHDDGEFAIEVDNLRFDHDGYAAVDDVSLRVRRGEVFALLGTNGAGKTTTLEIIQGYRRRLSGGVRVLGVDPGTSPQVLRRGTGVMLQEAGFFREVSVRDTLTLWQSLSSRVDDVTGVLDRVGLGHRADNSVQSLSGGERRRLDLAAAIWGSPELVILDEPTTGLDPASRRTLWNLIRELRGGGTTVLLTTHHLEEAESLADHVAIMHAGRVAVSGTLDEVLSSQPARVSADFDPGLVPAGWPRSVPTPAGITVDSTPVQRPHGRRVELVVESGDHQEAVLWLSLVARDAGVTLERLRANPAALEEVFLHVRREPAITDESLAANEQEQARL